MTISDLKYIIEYHNLPDNMEIRINVNDYFTVGGHSAKTGEYYKESHVNTTHFINKSFNQMTITCDLEKGFDDKGERTKQPKVTFRKIV